MIWNHFFYIIALSTKMSQKKDKERIRFCVLICESLYSDFDNISPFSELGNYSAIDYTINWLLENGIEEIFLFYSNLKTNVEEYYQTITKTVDLKLHLHYIKPSEFKSFGDVIRQIHFRNLLSEDFLILYADNITNLDLSSMISNHFAKKNELKNVQLTIAMRKGLSSSIYVLNSHTNQILQLQSEGNKQFSLNTEKINLKKFNVDLRRDLVPTDIFICTIQVVKSFKQTFEYLTMQDFIIGMLTSDVYQEKINVYELKSTEISYRINQASSFYLAYMNYICGYLTPYSLYSDDRFGKFQKSTTDKHFTARRFNKFIRKGCKISANTALSNNIYIGQSSKIEDNCTISKTIIGKNSVIGKNVTLNNCIVLDGCVISDNSKFQYCLIEKVNETIKIHNFRAKLQEQAPSLIERDIFVETPPSEELTFEEELHNLLNEKPQDETIIVSQLTRIRRCFEKSQRQFTKEFILVLKPQGVKGIENLTKEWGSVLNKVHHEQSSELISSLFFACVNIEDYSKAFHLILQYFYHYEILSKQVIIEWYNSQPSEKVTYVLCKAFIERLQQESQEDQQEDQQDEQEK